MYDIVVYDESVGQFVPAKDVLGKRVSFDSWAEASARLQDMVVNDPSSSFKVEYRTIKRRRKR